MGFTRPFIRRACAAVAAAVLPAALVVLAPTAVASADPADPTPVSSAALPTAQVNGVVWTQAVVGDVDYVGGSFSQSQPAGAADGVSITERSNLFAYDVTTGAAVPGFSATTNAQVRAIAASTDGSRIYIAGDFTVVDGQTRHHLAALDRDGNLISDFAPNVNSAVYSVASRGDVVYFGGAFRAVNGETRALAAAVSTTGATLPWAPIVKDNVVRAIQVSYDGTKVLLGGSFNAVNGVAHPGLAAVDPTVGASLPWAASAVVRNSGVNAAIYSLSTRGQVVYATGYVYGGEGNLEGAVAMNWSDGGIKWIESCHGDSYSSVPFNDALYVVSHAHDCSDVVGGWSSPGVASQWRRAQAFSQAATGVLNHNTEPNYYDFGGQPSPTLVAGWSPSINAGTYTGLDQGAWSAAAGSGYLALAGEFTRVNGVRQTGLVRFQGQPESADTGTAVPPATTPPAGTPPVGTPTGGTTPPTAEKPAQVSTPSAAALGATGIAVRWSAPKGATAAKVSSYVVKVSKGSQTVKTMTVSASIRLVSVTGLKKSTTYSVGVAAKNASGTGTFSKVQAVKTKAKGKNVSATKKPGKVQKPTSSTANAKVRVRWKAASTSGALAVSEYEVRIVLHGKMVSTVVVSAKTRSKLVTGLKRYTGYTLSVRAGNWAGWGSWSLSTTARTK